VLILHLSDIHIKTPSDVVLTRPTKLIDAIKTSTRIGSKDLTTTYERVFPQLQSVMMRLVYVSLRLEHYENFPESLVRKEADELQSNPFSFRVLRFLVARHFAIFPTD
jgi:hypothetical protein